MCTITPRAREVGLHELLERIVPAADGEQIELERRAIAGANASCGPRPSGAIEQRIGTSVSRVGLTAYESGLSGGTGPAAGVPYPASAASTIRSRSIESEIARRIRASSNGGL